MCQLRNKGPTKGQSLDVAAADTAELCRKRDGLCTHIQVRFLRRSVNGMARRPRSLLPDGVYHVGTRGVDKCTVYVDDDDRRAFLALLASVVADYDWHMHTLCLMTNHYHAVVETERPFLSLGMQRLNGRYAEDFNTKFKRTGHLWGDRFWARLVEDDRAG